MHIQVSDERTVDVVAVGTQGPTIVYHHGTPGVAEDYQPWVRAANAAGFRWISFSRPGYGDSTRRPGRTVADNCTDVTAVLDELGVDEFLAMGASGGGPHALACGALLAPRCVGVVSLAAVAPFDVALAGGLDWYDGMGPENHEEFGAAVAGEAEIRDYLDPQRADLASITGDQVAGALGGLIDEPDRAVLSGDYAASVALAMRTAVKLGVDGWLDDDLAFVRAWGFELDDVQVPVSLWQGTADRRVPYAHGQFLAERLPRVTAHLLPDEGHLSIALGRFDEVLADARSLLT